MATDIKPTEPIVGEDADIFFQKKNDVDCNPRSQKLEFPEIDADLFSDEQ